MSQERVCKNQVSSNCLKAANFKYCVCSLLMYKKLAEPLPPVLGCPVWPLVYHKLPEDNHWLLMDLWRKFLTICCEDCICNEVLSFLHMCWWQHECTQKKEQTTYRKSGNFCWMKISLEKFSCWKIFVGSMSYKNISILQHRSLEERMERVTAMEVFWKKLHPQLPRIWKSMGGDCWRGVDVRKRAQKLFRSIHCGCEKWRN